MKTILKRILLMSLLFVLLFGYSCTKDDDKYVNDEYTVIYNLMGGTFEVDDKVYDSYYETKVKHNSNINNITPTKDGYALVGWTTKLTETLNADYDFSKPIDKNTVLYAVWRRPQISFELNGGYFGKYDSVPELIDAFLNDFSSYKGWEVDEYDFFDASYGRSLEFFKNDNFGEKWTPLLKYLEKNAIDSSYLTQYINSNRNYNSQTSPFVRAEIAGFLKQIQDERTSWPQVKTGAYHDPYVLEGIWEYFKGDDINIYNASGDYKLPIPHKTGYFFKGWYDNKEFNGEPITYIPKGEFNDNTYYAKWQKNIKINYVSNVEIKYETKHDLFVAFFTEYYNFLNNNNYGNLLTDKDINTLEDFLNVALDYDYDNGQMRGLANIISGTFLDIEIGGKLENQTTNKFIGYCYHNNLFREFIDFIMEFFSYWREDEGYTTPNNNGSDFFASSWAALVDTCKFFYYDHNTSYVKSERVVNCFKFIPLVKPYFGLSEYYIGESLSSYNLKYVGYTFDDFYIDENYEISANEYLKNCTDESITVYIKFNKK